MVIYKTTCLINNKIYVGKDHHNDSRYLGSGTVLRKVIRKYGKENFKKEIIRKWGSAGLVRKELGFSPKCIHNVCYGKSKLAYGFYWCFDNKAI